MDLTPTFNQYLKGQGSSPVSARYNSEQLDAFLREAYRINQHIIDLTVYLRSIRQSYLSAAQPPRQHRGRPNDGDKKYMTSSQRSQVDAETKRTIREVQHAVSTLSDAERIRQETETTLARKRRAGLGGLAGWAAGGGAFREIKTPEEVEKDGQQDALRLCREGVLWFLRRGLERAVSIQSEMVEVRLKRELEKNKSVLYKAAGASSKGTWDSMGGGKVAIGNGHAGVGSGLGSANGFAAEQASLTSEQPPELSEEQIQLFERENQDMVKHYEGALDQVRAAEKSLLEISEQHNMLAMNLATQSAHIDQLMQDSEMTTENIGGGNKQLKKAAERKSTARMVFYGTCVFCTTLVLWDFFI